MTLVKSAPKKRFFWKLANFSIGRTVFWLKLGCIFYNDQINIFEIGMKRRIFYSPFTIFEEKKVFISYKEQLIGYGIVLFENLKGLSHKIDLAFDDMYG